MRNWFIPSKLSVVCEELFIVFPFFFFCSCRVCRHIHISFLIYSHVGNLYLLSLSLFFPFVLLGASVFDLLKEPAVLLILPYFSIFSLLISACIFIFSFFFLCFYFAFLQRDSRG